MAVSKDRTDFQEVALHSEGDEINTAQALQDAFEQATSLTNSRRASEDVRRPPANEARSPLDGLHPAMDPHPLGKQSDPGLSILQDSVLGLHPRGTYVFSCQEVHWSAKPVEVNVFPFNNNIIMRNWYCKLIKDIQ